MRLEARRKPARSRSAALARVEAPSSLERFEAESAAIKEWPEPRGANLAAPGLAAMLLVLALVLFVGRADIVVASTAARIVTSEAPIEFQSLDPSIVKSLNVEEGQQVQAGQVLATLDPTIAAAEVTQLKAQIDSLTTQSTPGIPILVDIKPSS